MMIVVIRRRGLSASHIQPKRTRTSTAPCRLLGWARRRKRLSYEPKTIPDGTCLTYRQLVSDAVVLNAGTHRRVYYRRLPRKLENFELKIKSCNPFFHATSDTFREKCAPPCWTDNHWKISMKIKLTSYEYALLTPNVFFVNNLSHVESKVFS